MINQVTQLCEKLSFLRSARTPFESDWSNIRDLVHVNAVDFNGGTSIRSGAKIAGEVFDGTAPWALEQFAAGLHSMVTNPSSRWAQLELQSIPRENIEDHDVLSWLDEVSDILYTELSRSESLFHSSAHELYLDIGSFGTGVQFEDYNTAKGCLSFMACPLSDCWIQENHFGIVDTLYRLRKMTRQQILDKFGQAPEQIVKENNPTATYDVYHAVFPRSKFDDTKLDSLNMPFASVWFSEQFKYKFSEGGYNSFPYHVPRWTKMAGQCYGRAPAHACLPDILMINKMAEVTIKGAEKMVDPPLQADDDAFIGSIKTSPGSIIWKEPGSDPITPLVTGGRPEIGLEMMDSRRDHIIKSFYVDWLLQQKNSTQMTATEVIDRREEKLRMMAPMIGRLESEFCGPIIRRSFELLSKYDKIPEPPPGVLEQGIEIRYSSPAAEAQKAGKAINSTRFIETIIPLLDVDPQLRHYLNLPAYLIEQANIRDVTSKVINPPDVVQGKLEQEAQQQQAMMEVEQAKIAAGAVKDIAHAQNLTAPQ